MSSSPTDRYLTFMVGSDQYALALSRVREVVGFQPTTRVPDAAPWVRGVTNLRGRIAPVIDLGVKCGLPPTEPGPETCLLVLDVDVGGQSHGVALVVHAVGDVIEPGPDAIEVVPTLGTQIRSEFLLGMARSGDAFALILDGDKVLAAEALLAAETRRENG